LAAPVPPADGHYDLDAVTVAALLATFFGPAFFATEVLGYSFTRTLPISRRTLLLGKASLIVLIYTVASLLVMGLVAFRVGDPVPFLVFALAELPAVLGAAVLELGVLFNRAERTGIPLTNLYSGAWWTMLVVIPGLVVAGIPLVLYTVGQYYHTVWAVPSMALSALALLTVTGLWALWGRGRAA
jgi:predicted permease